jgi:hypothetical protein
VLYSATPFPVRKISPIREAGLCFSSFLTGDVMPYLVHVIRILHFMRVRVQ